MNPVTPHPAWPQRPPWLRAHHGIALMLAASLHLGGWAALERWPLGTQAPVRVLSGMLLAPPPPQAAADPVARPSAPRATPERSAPRPLAAPPSSTATPAPSPEAATPVGEEMPSTSAGEAVTGSRPAGAVPASMSNAAAVDGTTAARPPDFRADYLNNPQPAYPILSRKQREAGEVRLRVRVSAEGSAEQVLLHASSGHPRLDAAALAAVRAWRFTPAHRDGVAVAGWVEVPIQFTLEN